MRVSTKEQKFALQHDALLAAGVRERYLYPDVASGAQEARLGLEACLKALHPGDTLVVWKLDRVARSLLHLLEMMQDLQERQVRLQILPVTHNFCFRVSGGMLRACNPCIRPKITP